MEIIIGLTLVSIGLGVLAYSNHLKKLKYRKEIADLYETIKIIESTKTAVPIAKKRTTKKKSNETVTTT